MNVGIKCALLAILAGAPLGAQAGCQVNGYATCNTPTDATRSIFVTVPTAARLTLSTGTIALGNPTNLSYDAGNSTPVSFSFNIRANAAWSISIRSGQANWSATGPAARVDKPASDLQWSQTLNGAYADLTTSSVGLSSGAATANTTESVFLRTKLAWLLDTPGSYTLPVQLIITAP